MGSQPVLMSLLLAAVTLPMMFRRSQRRIYGAQIPNTPAVRRGRRAVAGVSLLLLLGGLGGGAYAANGDRDGSKTSVSVESVLAKDTPAGNVTQVLSEAIAKDRASINMTWLMVGGVLVLFMQAGFALVETGFTRAKNAVHTMMMNLVIFALGVVGWFVCGYALMFGATDQSGLLGLTKLGDPIHIGKWNVLAKSGFFLTGHAYDVAILGFFFFQLVFMDATADRKSVV